MTPITRHAPNHRHTPTLPAPTRPVGDRVLHPLVQEVATVPASVVPAPVRAAVLPAVERPAPARPAVPAALPVVGGDLPVPLVTGEQVRYANLDYAASAPALQAVADHVCQALPYYSSVHRGAGYASQVSTALYEGARQSVGHSIGARPDDVIVFVRHTTDALNLLATAVPAGGEVLYLDSEHHANLLPWREQGHRALPIEATLEATLVSLERALAQRPTALVAITGSSNVTGEILPIRRITALAHAHGARIVVDAAQLAPHRRIDLTELDVDYVAFSGHKVYAPFGAGVLAGRRDWLDAAPAYLAGGGAVREVGAESTEWAAAPQRHEAGTPNVLGAAALAEALRVLAGVPAEVLEQHEEALRSRLADGLTAIAGVQVLSIWPDTDERIGVVTFVVDGHDSGRVAAYLSAEHGIGVRDGRFCAHPLLARLGHADGALRASLGVGSSSDDVDRLVAAIRQLVTVGEGWSYAVDGGRWAPSPDPRPIAAWLPETGAAVVDAGASPCSD